MSMFLVTSPGRERAVLDAIKTSYKSKSTVRKFEHEI